MEALKLKGPYTFFAPGPTIDDIGPGVNGVYLWCVRIGEDAYRAHYVGETLDIMQRQRGHKAKQSHGEYSAFCPDGLKRNEKILMHRANEGLIARFAGLSREAVNNDYLAAMNVFVADLGPDANRTVRRAYESAFVRAIEDNGHNILHAGSIQWFPPMQPRQVAVDTGGAHIEALSATILNVYGG